MTRTVRRHDTLAGGGFTLIELLVVLVVLGIIAAVAAPRFLNLASDAGHTAVQAQARALISQDGLNRAACELGSPDCIDISTTGDDACEEFIQEFMPEFDSDQFQVENISSDTPREQWADNLEDGQALFQVTRFLGDSNPPSDDWLDTWDPTQPRILSRS